MSSDDKRHRYALIALVASFITFIFLAWLSQPTNNEIRSANYEHSQKSGQDDITRLISAITHFSPWEETHAQWLVAIFSTVGVGVSVWAVILVRDTLSETRKAVKAADDAVIVTREMGKDQSRAYVHVDRAELRWGDDQAIAPSFRLYVVNTGHTPAKWFAYKGEVFTRKLDEDGRVIDLRKFSQNPVPERDFVRWNALGPGKELSFNIDPITIEDVRETYGKKDVSLEVAGVLRYCTFFDEIFESEFWFMLKRPPIFKFDNTEGSNHGLARYGVSEKPHPMQGL